MRVDLQRHEDMLAAGIPDVSYGAHSVQGWIELKCVKKWTRNGVKVPWRPGQREWLVQRGKHGDRCWLLMRIGKINFLFRHDHLPPRDTRFKRAEYDLWSVLSWETGEDVWGELVEVLTK